MLIDNIALLIHPSTHLILLLGQNREIIAFCDSNRKSLQTWQDRSAYDLG